MNKLVYGRYGVLLGQGRAPAGVSEIRVSKDNKTLFIQGNFDTTVEMTVSKLNIFQQSGTMYFRSKGVDYVVRELRDNDGLWLSRYSILLPEDALSALIKLGGYVELTEQFVSFATDDSPYVVAVVYSNSGGRFSRQDGQWVKIADNDTTLDSLIPTAIDPNKAREFLDLYDDNFVSVSDAQAFEANHALEAVNPQDRPAEEA